MKKIAFFINSLAGGGAERILSTIIHELHEKFDTTLVLIEDIIEFNIPNDVKIIYLSKKGNSKNGLMKFLNIGFYAYRFSKVCQEENIDISFSLTTRPNLINVLSKSFYPKTKKIVYEVATPSVQYENKSISSYIVKSLIKILYPKADCLLANSKGVSNDLEENFVNNQDIHTVYSPINVKKIFNSTHVEDFKLSNDSINFITVGRLDSGKNHQMMIRAFSKIKKQNTALYILGVGELYQDLLTTIKELKLEKRVFLLGFDSNPFKYLKQCDVFLFTSRYEGLPTVLIEALACELPIISTDCPSGPREILSEKSQSTNSIDSCEYGMLTPVDDDIKFTKAIDKLLEDKSLYNKYKENAMKRAESFSMEKSIEKLTNVLERV